MTYLNTGWAGPSPRSVTDAIRGWIDYEELNGLTSQDVVDTRLALFARSKEAVAGLLNASPDEILLTQNTSEGLNVVMRGLPWREGDEIVTCNLEHIAITTPIILAQQLHGVQPTILPIAADETQDEILTKIEDALTDRTRMVFLSHIEYSCGLRMPVEEIARLTKPRGIWFMLDGAQAAGHVPVDVRGIDCDFYSIPGQKWLLGPDGTGALYIRKELIPQVTSTDAGGKAIEEFDYPASHKLTAGIEKFSVSTKSAPLRAGFNEGIRFVEDIGIDAIERRNLELASSLKASLADLPGVQVLSPMEDPGSSGIVSFTIDGADPEQVATSLWEQHRILIRHVEYPACLRASLDFFNTADEVAQLVQVVHELAK